MIIVIQLLLIVRISEDITGGSDCDYNNDDDSDDDDNNNTIINSNLSLKEK